MGGAENVRLFAYIVRKGDAIPQDETFNDCWHTVRSDRVPGLGYELPSCADFDIIERNEELCDGALSVDASVSPAQC